MSVEDLVLSGLMGWDRLQVTASVDGDGQDPGLTCLFAALLIARRIAITPDCAWQWRLLATATGFAPSRRRVACRVGARYLVLAAADSNDRPVCAKTLLTHSVCNNPGAAKATGRPRRPTKSRNHGVELRHGAQEIVPRS